MRETIIAITGGTIILPDQVVQGSILVQHGRIKAILSEGQADQLQAAQHIIDARGMYIAPGIIDIHSDAIEKEIEPRPGSRFPLDMAFYELEKQLVGHGITTMYHGLSMSGGAGVRSDEVVEQALQEFYRLSRMRSLIRHRLHLRYELINFPAIDIVKQHISDGTIHLLSFMDHSPGQGQYSRPGSYATYISKTYGLVNEEAEAMARHMVEQHALVDWHMLKQIAHSALVAGIPLASHDDDSAEKVDQVLDCGVSITEFPMNLPTALYASERGLHVSVGAPNIVRGGSHGKNMSALDAIHTNAAHIICSDYYPSAMLAAVFRLIDEGMDTAQAFRMVTLNPARAMKIDHNLGSIEVGKSADILLIEVFAGYPLVRKTLVNGETVYQSDYVQL